MWRGRAVCGMGARGIVVSPQALWNTGFMRGAYHKRLLVPAFLFVLALLAPAARGDEFHLKDGSKIIGSIVGFEDGAFKVQTTYGFAYVRKDSIAEIVPTEKKGAQEAGPPAAPSRSAAPPAATSGPKTGVAPMPRPIPKYVTAPSKPGTAASAGAGVTPPAIAGASASQLLPDLSALLHSGAAVDPRAQP